METIDDETTTAPAYADLDSVAKFANDTEYGPASEHLDAKPQSLPRTCALIQSCTIEPSGQKSCATTHLPEAL
jgi:hypothetical protein